MTTMTMRGWFLGCLALSVLIASSAVAAGPRALTYGGTLLDSQGHPVTTATTIVFRLYSQSTGGAIAWKTPYR